MKLSTKQIVGIGLFTAIVVVLQALAINFRFGMFTISLVLAPIIVGAALYGPLAGAWLGLVFGIVVVLTDAGAFLAVSVPGTIITCLLKGVLAGLFAGAVFRALEKKNSLAAVICAAVTAPVVNTGVFLLGCLIFFYDTISAWGAGLGFASTGAYMLFGLVGMNFIVELVINLVLATVILQLVKIGRKMNRSAK